MPERPGRPGRLGQTSRVDPGELLARIDDRTRVLALSWVEYASGQRFDLAPLATACHARGVLLVVDVIQGLGALTLDVEAAGVDVACGAAHKWLLGPEGIGLLYISDRVTEAIRPTRGGWRSMRNQNAWGDFRLDWAAGAQRHESGTLNVLGIHALGGGLDLLLEAGPAAIERRVLALAERAAEGLAGLGFQVVSPRGPGETSGIVAGVHPRCAAAELAERLAERRVFVTERSGRLRVSPHFYNTEDEIDLFLAEADALTRP